MVHLFSEIIQFIVIIIFKSFNCPLSLKIRVKINKKMRVIAGLAERFVIFY